MRDTQIIGLTGPKTIGKTTTAKALMAEIIKGGLDYTPHILSFATPIEHALLQMFGLEEAPEDKEAPFYNGHSWRDLKKSFGTEWGRRLVCSEIWCDRLIARVQEITVSNLKHPPLIIIDDLRMENEYETLREYAGRDFVRVGLHREGVEYTNDHATEKGIPIHLSDLEICMDHSTPDEVALDIMGALDISRKATNPPTADETIEEFEQAVAELAGSMRSKPLVPAAYALAKVLRPGLEQMQANMPAEDWKFFQQQALAQLAPYLP